MTGPDLKYRWILFDADGTLFDFHRAAHQALIESCQQVLDRFEPEFEPIYEQINLAIWREFEAGQITAERLRTKRFELFLAALELTADPAEFSRVYLGRLSGHADLIAGAEDLIRHLAPRVGLAIITNGLQEVQRPRFARATIGQFFSEIIISEEVGAAKPDPAIFSETFRRLGNPERTEVLIVGDSLTSDIRGGNNFGLDTCWYNPQGRPREHDVAITYEISHLSELRRIITG